MSKFILNAFQDMVKSEFLNFNGKISIDFTPVLQGEVLHYPSHPSERALSASWGAVTGKEAAWIRLQIPFRSSAGCSPTPSLAMHF